ncbi:MAG: hypothetical protein NTX27_13765 [Verrucomicrobia bacterium]|nr:hypothetical protein [Verrucomicrobiota bacterium]
MTLNWKKAWPCLFALALVVLTGCSGVNATRSVSPATFLLPGVMKYEAPKPASPDQTLPQIGSGGDTVES